MRLDRFVSEQAGVSRRDAKELIRKKCVSVNGKAAGSSSDVMDPQRDEVTVRGRKIIYREHVYIMLNKPAGVVCATRDELSPTVLGLIPESLRRKGLFPAGRLDKDTEGFVFITDDGELAHRMLSPKSHVEKEYEVTLNKPADHAWERIFAEGMTIDGGEKCLPAKLIFTEKENVVRLIICEGKFHQVKRMMGAVGSKVTFLKRVRIGGIVLDEKLPLGECREILHKEIKTLLCKKEIKNQQI
ncbi:MAG: pseudouridine synthase [Huintestinicola sp.]